MTRPVYVVYGPDAYLRTQAIHTILRDELGPDDAGLGPTRLDGDSADLAQVLDEVRTFSLLGDRRLVIVEDADGFITRYRQALETYCEAPSDSGCLVFVCDSFDARTRLFKTVQRLGQAIKCESPRGRAVIAWILDRARTAYAKHLSPDAAARLRELAGDNLGVLDSELSKLALYVGGRDTVVPADIEALVGNNREENVFAVLDAMAEGDAGRALQYWEQVLATDRAAPGRAIGGLAWGVRRLLQAKHALAAGTPMTQLARQFFTEPAVLKRRLDRVSAEQLERRLVDLLQADLDSKTGFSPVDSSVEKFIVKHTVAETP